MTPGIPTKVIASSLGLAAFAIATIAGLAADNPADSILTRAIVSMFVCHAVGLIVGTLAEKAVTDGITQYITAASGEAGHTVGSEGKKAGMGTAAKSAVSA